MFLSYVSKEQFKGIETFVITNRELSGKFVSLTSSDLKIIGFPVRIENSKYLRNAVMFNFCFVVALDCQTSCFEPILKKLALLFSALEVSHCAKFLL